VHNAGQRPTGADLGQLFSISVRPGIPNCPLGLISLSFAFLRFSGISTLLKAPASPVNGPEFECKFQALRSFGHSNIAAAQWPGVMELIPRFPNTLLQKIINLKTINNDMPF